MAESAILLGQHRVRSLANERVPKGVLVLAWETAAASPRHELAADQIAQALAELHRHRRLPEERADAAQKV